MECYGECNVCVAYEVSDISCPDHARSYDAIKAMAGNHVKQIEYWHDAVVEKESHSSTNDILLNVSDAGWKADRPPESMVRVPGIVHEACSLYMSDNLERDPHASVDSKYRPRGCDGVYVTGAAIFPTSGSWNRMSGHT